MLPRCSVVLMATGVMIALLAATQAIRRAGLGGMLRWC